MLRPSYPIVTDRLILRPFTEDDFEAMYAYQSLPEVARYLYWGPRDRAATAEALKLRMSMTVLEREGDSLVLAVLLRETGELVGDVNLAWQSEAHQQGEFGFVFDPAHHGRGYAAEAAVEMLRLGFEGIGLHRIIGRCDGRNEASAKLMAKLGMRREAHFVRNEIVKGEWTDEVVYAMLADEWAARVS
ncbi:GNAT family N-acetyltransferase [Actinophytocola sp.]|uniref:GNAT family N-acetyltransferase n=1 Tax=Actinophytocola sp. TaxID=1872138 RepID=UPI003D6B793F